jgi:hypothetical protein
MSAFDLITNPLPVIKQILEPYGAELRETKFADTYMIKFKPDAYVIAPAINPLKGLIFNHRTGQIYSLTYPVPIEVKDLSMPEQNLLMSNLSQGNYQVQEALDGTLLRYAYIDETNEWLLSTNNKDDANQAYWMNGVSFAKQFESVRDVTIDFDSLNKNYVYLFVMCHPLNVIVVNHEKSMIHHVATYDRRTLTEIDIDIGIPKPPTFDLTPSEIRERMSASMTTPVNSAGYMIIVREGDMCHRYRCENANYTAAKRLRGNSNNIEYTLLELLLEHGEEHINTFLLYYPIYSCEYISLIQRINKLAAKLYREYGQRYKEHREIMVHSRHHKFLVEIHQKVYRDTLRPIHQTVQYDDIRKFLLQQSPAKVLYLINYIFDVSSSI